MEPLTASGLFYGTRCLRDGDTTYMPGSLPAGCWPGMDKELVDEPWVRKLIPGRKGGFVLSLIMRYEADRCRTGREPAWVENAGDDLKRILRVEWVLSGERSFENPMGIGFLPHLGFGYEVLGGGLAEDVEAAFGSFRLCGVAQLGAIQEPVPLVPGQEIESFGYGHTRLQHVFDVPLVSKLIARNNNLSPTEKKLLWIAGQTHDARTPAGGDTTKLADFAAFDEDRRYGDILKEIPRKKFREWGVEPDHLWRIILGEYPLLSEIQDAADKSAYVARDVMHCVGRPKPRPAEFDAIEAILREDPLAAAIWSDARVLRGRLVFTEPMRLARLLRLRALMFRGTYQSVDSRRMDWLVKAMVTKHLYATRAIGEKDLFSMRDSDLEARINKFLGRFRFHIQWGRPETELFREPGEARARARVLLWGEEPHLVLIESVKGVTNSAVHFLTRAGGQVMPFAEAFPEEAGKITALLTTEHPVRLYHFPAATFEAQEEAKQALLLRQRQELEG